MTEQGPIPADISLLNALFMGFERQKEVFERRGFVKFSHPLVDPESRPLLQALTQEEKILVHTRLEEKMVNGETRAFLVRYVWDLERFYVEPIQIHENDAYLKMPTVIRKEGSEGYTLVRADTQGNIILYKRKTKKEQESTNPTKKCA